MFSVSWLSKRALDLTLLALLTAPAYEARAETGGLCAPAALERECAMPGASEPVCSAVRDTLNGVDGDADDHLVARLIALSLEQVSNGETSSAPTNLQLINTRLIACGLSRSGQTDMAATVLADAISVAHRTLPAISEPAGALTFLAELIMTQIDLDLREEAVRSLQAFDDLSGGLSPLYSVVLAHIQLGGALQLRGEEDLAETYFTSSRILAPLIPGEADAAIPPGHHMLLDLAQTQINTGAWRQAADTLDVLDRAVATLPRDADRALFKRAMDHQRDRLRQ
jgi:hypothetical protein